jgi:hypothetical protein
MWRFVRRYSALFPPPFVHFRHSLVALPGGVFGILKRHALIQRARQYLYPITSTFTPTLTVVDL